MRYDQEFTAEPPESLEHSGCPILVKGILESYDLEPSEMLVSLNKDPKRVYNTFIWKISLKTPALPICFEYTRPYTMKPPVDGVSSVVMRIFNPTATGLVQANRVQNEVASMHLVREGLAKAGTGLEEIIPAVYAWEPEVKDEDNIANIGWILMETKPGLPASHNFWKRGNWGIETYMEQLAEILRLIQDIELPSTVTKYGGLTIDEDGNIVTGKTAYFGGGPWTSYTDFWIVQLIGIRRRIDDLIQKLDEIFSQSVAVQWRKLIHGGIAMENVLFDPVTRKITALLDFERACVAHPSLEFILSFRDFGGNIVANNIPFKSLEEDLIDQIVFDAFKIPIARHKNTEVYGRTTRFWEQAMTWDKWLQAKRVTKPSRILGIREIRLVAKITDSIWPKELEDEKLTPKQVHNIMSKARKRMVPALRLLGIS
ncbi:hypothetical protein F5Y06DRAFT_292052 [Hypoxylon sp. FL0890]|nr:hypothetical protein F5Y06DRAFT_292052 [Hypoxylon sp. FL0890]